MSEIANSEGASETEKPVDPKSDITFPPFPEPTDADFEDDISEVEREYYKNKFQDLNTIKMFRLHCTACDRHLGCSTLNEGRMRVHPMLRTLVCHTCHTFYNSGEFDKGDDGSELYCRWCGQGGQVYCCSDCPHVFCAKCIKRNLGGPKIKEIENADDWKCFKCNPKCLWDIRAICWAVLRYCDLRNKMTYHTEDPELREAYQKDCAIDYTECCKHKVNRRQKSIESSKKKEPKKEAEAKIAATIISKIPSTIQVKKFASINLDESVKPEKKAQKRSASPKHTFIMKNPIAITPCPPRMMSATNTPPLVKKMRLPVSPLVPVRPHDRKPVVTYPRIRPRPTLLNPGFNGFHNVGGVFNNVAGDNINLSLESLTQGLDMSAVAAMSGMSPDDDVVCTPDFPLEPMCEVTEDNDDDVQCITPGPIATPKISNPPPLVSTTAPKVMPSDMSSENIIQMTENDVTVNAATGGLKFRVDPQTLSSNKMYRLPDGRIFAINANPNMPGGYSATIVAVAETAGKQIPKGATYAAKLSAVSTSTPTPKPIRTIGGRMPSSNTSKKRSVSKPSKVNKSAGARECDFNVPVEWYRYNLIDAVDALEYALSRLQKLKKEATTMYLRSRNVNEMRSLHKTLERLLNTSAYRFNEIRDNINKEFKQYVAKKMNENNSEDDDDDDVEILPDLENADDPIFIDENSVESNTNGSENQEVDLTGAGSSEHNDSAENKIEYLSKNDDDSLLTCNEIIDNDNEPTKTTDGNQSPNRNAESPENTMNEDVILPKPADDSHRDSYEDTSKNEKTPSVNNDEDPLKNEDTCTLKSDDDPSKNQDTSASKKDDDDSLKNEEAATLENDKNNEPSTEKSNEPGIFFPCNLKCKTVEDINGDINEVKNKCSDNNDGDVDMEKKNVDDKADSQVDCDEKNQDSEMSEEMIENLLKDTLDENATNTNSLDIPEELHDT